MGRGLCIFKESPSDVGTLRTIALDGYLIIFSKPTQGHVQRDLLPLICVTLHLGGMPWAGDAFVLLEL